MVQFKEKSQNNSRSSYPPGRGVGDWFTQNTMSQIFSHERSCMTVVRNHNEDCRNTLRFRLVFFFTSPARPKIFKMEAVSIMDGSSFTHTLGQRTTNSSMGSTSSSRESAMKAMTESSQALESPFRSVFDTPQSSVVDIVLRQAPRQTRVARFVECACVSGGPCVGRGGQATCSCSLAPEMKQAPRIAEKKRFIKKAAQGIVKVLRRAWNRPIRALNNATARAETKQNGYELMVTW